MTDDLPVSMAVLPMTEKVPAVPAMTGKVPAGPAVTHGLQVWPVVTRSLLVWPMVRCGLSAMAIVIVVGINKTMQNNVE